ncbi:MAG: hypothetical protein HFJ30_00350 [Clostridia bacterium]|jgi:hypothetical protein|nr:hypothetical protein [Clostridia bacterium]
MENIEAGEYVRTKEGRIARFIKRLERGEDVEDGMLFDSYICEKHKNIRYCYLKTKMVKHSKNIIDLIEAGDVLKIDNEKYEVIYDESYEKLGILIPNRKQLAVRHSSVAFIFQKYKNIEILTKEQWKTNCYRLKV